MIISASRRTDLPALYSRWLNNRIEAGFCDVPNPFNPRQVSRVSLRREDVEAIVFWTRHAPPAFPLLERLDRLGYSYYFHYTITGYGYPLEARTPPREVAVRGFRALAERLPFGAVIWRYDPIILSGALTLDSHLERFAWLAGELEGAAARVVTSLLSPYRKTRRRLARLAQPADYQLDSLPDDAAKALLSRLVGIAADHGMQLQTCAHDDRFMDIGARATRCVDPQLLTELYGGRWPQQKDRGQRTACRCAPSKDIGMNDTCTLGCAYCYATQSDILARKRHEKHDPTHVMLVPQGPAVAPARVDD